MQAVVHILIDSVLTLLNMDYLLFMVSVFCLFYCVCFILQSNADPMLLYLLFC